MKIVRPILLVIAVIFAAGALTGCATTYRDVSNDCIAVVLTPTGYEKDRQGNIKVYGPGQVNIGKLDENDRGNKLVLIEKQSLTVKEQFVGAAVSEDKEDHRLMTHDQNPVTMDTRFTVTARDWMKEPNSIDLILEQIRPGAEQDRVLRIMMKDIYETLGKPHLRGKLRERVAGYDNFTEMFNYQSALNEKLKTDIVNVFAARIWDAQVQLQATRTRMQAIKEMGDFINSSPTYRTVFEWNSLKEIVQEGNAKGSNTVVVAVPGGGASPVPWPYPPKR